MKQKAALDQAHEYIQTNLPDLLRDFLKFKEEGVHTSGSKLMALTGILGPSFGPAKSADLAISMIHEASARRLVSLSSQEMMAQAIKGMASTGNHLYVAVHEHEYGISNYFFLADTNEPPTGEDNAEAIAKAIGIDFDPTREGITYMEIQPQKLSSMPTIRMEQLANQDPENPRP